MNFLEQIGILTKISNVVFSQQYKDGFSPENIKPNVKLISSSGETSKLINLEARAHNDAIHSYGSNWVPEIRDGRTWGIKTLSDEAKEGLKEDNIELSFTADSHEEALSKIFEQVMQPGYAVEVAYISNSYGGWGDSSPSPESSYYKLIEGDKWQTLRRIHSNGFEVS